MYVITGGSSGIGRALAIALAKRGQRVVVVGRREVLLQQLAKQHALMDYCCADVSTPEGRKTLLTRLENEPSLLGLIHNAGVIDPICGMHAIREEDWNQVMATNVNAPLFLSQALLPQLQNGRVLHIGSAAAYFPVRGWSAYCVSKAALAMLTQCWQLESSQTLFASVMPGIIDTPMQETIRKASHMDEEKHDFFKSLYDAKQLIAPETVACFLTWLLLDVNGETYVSKEWDIYDTSHHVHWLKSPHTLPHWEA